MRPRAARLLAVALSAVLGVAAVAPAARADAHADSQSDSSDTAFVGLGVLTWRYDDAGEAVEAEGTGLSVLTGTDLSEHFGVAAEVGSGGSGTVVLAGATYDLKVQLLVRLHARLTVPVSIFRLYALAGVTTVQFETHTVEPGPLGATGLRVDGTSTGPSAGAGAEVRVLGDLHAGVEWLRYLGDRAFDLDTALFFARYRFR